ncbi:MAG: hypothetical protein ACD_80C00066G0001 [uncultured bacterium (gcode 4)]|uniref:Uncharacterized protein n=1 Tax=uncultured bacterium (gcode 4) TaxID=1234023 RepID=K1XJN9_9BACT|nr:MAG: hypothetical protein ACD_80C00066G0001 [uncultured bacterium (gcode 4)]
MILEINNNKSPRSFDEIAEAIIKHIANNREEFLSGTGFNKGKLTIENLEMLAGNHLFDDCPELFGISKIEGHIFREYFQKHTGEKTILEIRAQLANLFDEEYPEFIRWLK